MNPANPARISITVRRHVVAAAVLASLCLASPSARAQAVAAPSETTTEKTTKVDKSAVTRKPAEATTTATSSNDPEAAIVLSPFEVVSEKDKGFMATNAGTATKLGLDLADMPAAYSVMTRELIDSLGITDLEQSSQWVVGGALAPGDGTPNDSTSTPNTVFTNTRGQMNQMGQQRNFFANNGIGDTYNMERIDFGRGPNAVLFNYGDLNNPFAGGVSAQTKRANLGRSTDSVSFRVGSWGYRRGTIDSNRPIGKNAAVRGNLIYQKSDGYRLGEQDDRRGGAVALVYRPTQRTEVRISGNYDHIERTRSYAALFDNFSGWDGVTVLDGPITNAILGPGRNSSTRAPLPGATFNGGQFLSSGGDVQGIARISTTPQNVYIPGQGIMNWQNYGTTVRADANEYVPMFDGTRSFSRYDLWRMNVDNGVFTGSTIAPNNLLGLGTGGIGGGHSILYQNNVPSDMYARAINGSKFRMPDKRFTLNPRGTPFTIENNKDLNLGLSHKVNDRLWVYLNADVNVTTDRIINQSAANRLRWAYIDINKNLPDGTPNPHFLEPYSDDVTIAFRRYSVENAGLRPGVNYSLNAGKWGKYVFNGGLGLTTRTQKDREWILSMAQAADPRTWSGNSSVVKVREYWSNPIMPFGLTTPQSYYSNTFDAANNVVGNARSTVTPHYVLNGNYFGGGWDYHEVNKSVTLAASGRYFWSEKLQKERLVLVTGFAMNRVHTSRKDPMILGDQPTSWDGVTFVSKPNAPADWGSLTYIPKDANGNPTASIARPATTRPRATSVENVAARLPQYGNDRFRDDYNLPDRKATTRNTTLGFSYDFTRWLGTKVNYSNSFNPPSVGALDINTNPALPYTAFGYDARVSVTPFGDRLVLNLGWFYNESANTRTGSPVQGPINSLYGTRNYDDTNTSNRNSFGFYDVTGSDYQSVNNTGGEIELVGRVARGLQITSGYSRFRGHNFDRFPLTVPYVDAHAGDFLKVLKAAGGMLDPNNKPTGAAHAPGLAVPDPSVGSLSGNQLTNQTNAINAYNNLWVQYENVVNKTADTAYAANGNMKWGGTFNLFVRYEFQTGMLRGLRVGLGRTWTAPYSWTTQANNVVPNPNYDKTKALNTNAGLLDKGGHYTYKDSSGNATGFNAPWMPDPNINQFAPPLNIKSGPTNLVLNVGYSRRFGKGAGWLSNRQINCNLVINNLLNRQQIFDNNGATLRAPGGDYLNNQFTRINTRGGLANSGFQQPINGSLEVTLNF